MCHSILTTKCGAPYARAILMDPKNEMIDLGMNPDDGSALVGGTEMPDGQTYDAAQYQPQQPTMSINGASFGDPED